MFVLPTNDRSALHTESSSRDNLGHQEMGFGKLKDEKKRKKHVGIIKNTPDLIIPLVADVQTTSDLNGWNDLNDLNDLKD